MPGPCETCKHLSAESEDDYGPMVFYGCRIKSTHGNLWSFPFKKDMPCHVPNGWENHDIEADL